MSKELYRNQYRTNHIRAKWHDYAGGVYFITINVADKVHHDFGEIKYQNKRKKMELSMAGTIVAQFIQEVPLHHHYASILQYVIMPNHLHLLIAIDRGKVPYRRREVHDSSINIPLDSSKESYSEKMRRIANQEGWLSVVIGSFKSAVSKRLHEEGLIFHWQTRFYDRIIFTEEELNATIKYISQNIDRWKIDHTEKDVMG